jgi:N-methylhydantoinase A
MAERFELAYERIYGLRVPGSEVEVVTWLVTVSTAPTPVQPIALPPATRERQAPLHREVWEPARGERQPFGLHWRFDLQVGEQLTGPALVAEDETTIVVPAGWVARLDEQGNFVMEAQA